jgi:hypothetical protein
VKRLTDQESENNAENLQKTEYINYLKNVRTWMIIVNFGLKNGTSVW